MERDKDLSNGLTQPLLEKLRLSHGWVQFIMAETDTLIKLDGRLVTLQNFKGQFTSAPAKGNLSHKAQHFFGYPAASVSGQYDHVMDVNQRSASEG